ncbi:hypothetical protein L873DRAFT_1336921 [Choiromyces venosus 120613-1]|uniref:Uncharacterized protein n=1 Tax=Choiromyces venosus 120613-1 TaxID=1336337 RepID=A0A3N4JDP8_9PEZI|nr:hypothetical protein L873DRAFT_1336921 [Choiromyces venosus 120613-1]
MPFIHSFIHSPYPFVCLVLFRENISKFFTRTPRKSQKIYHSLCSPCYNPFPLPHSAILLRRWFLCYQKAVKFENITSGLFSQTFKSRYDKYLTIGTQGKSRITIPELYVCCEYDIIQYFTSYHITLSRIFHREKKKKKKKTHYRYAMSATDPRCVRGIYHTTGRF